MLVHLTLRCFWVGIVGIASVSPKEKSSDTSNWGPAYRAFKEETHISLDTHAARIDKFCRALFGLTFTLLIMMIGISIQTALLLGVAKLIHAKFFSSLAWVTVFLIAYTAFLGPFILLSLIDKLVAKLPFLRGIGEGDRWKKFGSTAFRLSGYLNPFILLASPVFAALYANFNKKVLTGIFVFYYVLFIGVMFGSTMSYKSFVLFPDTPKHFGMDFAYYGNLREEGQSYSSPMIQSDVITEKYIKLFITYRNAETDSLLAQFPNLKPLRTEGLFIGYDTEDSVQVRQTLDAFQSFYRVWLDDSLLTKPTMMFYREPKTKQPGVMVYISTDSLTKGIQHTLRVHKPFPRTKPDYIIPFFL
jgi:hypothetical protein